MNPTFARKAVSALAVAALALIGGASQAEPRGPGDISLFVSPCGRPYRALPSQPYPVVAWFTAADANKDGKLDRAEFRADAYLFFRVLDRDNNGVIENEEVIFYEHHIVPEMLMYQEVGALPSLLIRAQYGGIGQIGGPDGPPVVDSGTNDIPGETFHAPEVAEMQGAAAFNFLREPEPVSASDGNFDHRITAEEFQAAADRRFKLLDKAGLGYLTLDTLPKTAFQRAFEREHPPGRNKPRG